MTRMQDMVVVVAAGAVLTTTLDAQWPTPAPAPPAVPEIWGLPPIGPMPEIAPPLEFHFELPHFQFEMPEPDLWHMMPPALEHVEFAFEGLAWMEPALAFAEAPMAWVEPMLIEVPHALAEAEAMVWPVTPRAERAAPHWPEVRGSKPPDSLYREARTALNNGNHREAVRLLRQLRSQYPRSEYVGDSYYWEAFALQRIGGRDELRQARDLLRTQERQHTNAATRRDAPQLVNTINGMLARMGDAEAAQAVAIAADAAAPRPAPTPQPTPRPPRPQGDEAIDMREAALNALMYMDPERATPILREVLASRDPESAKLRRRAVWLVARQKSADREDILLRSAANDPDQEVREQAVYWLSTVHTDRALMALDSILRTSPDNEIREKAVYALSRQDDARAEQSLRTFAQQGNQPEAVRKQAIYWLSRKGGAENQAFLRQLFGQLESQELKEQVIYALGRSDDRTDREWMLQIALDQSQPIELRKTALHWAGRRDDVSMADLGRLYDQMPDREIRKQLVYVFSRRDEPEAVDKLMAIAQNDPDAELRKQAIYWLGRAGSKDPRVAEFLMKLINP
jgi:HEAT repeat protein